MKLQNNSRADTATSKPNPDAHTCRTQTSDGQGEQQERVTRAGHGSSTEHEINIGRDGYATGNTQNPYHGKQNSAALRAPRTNWGANTQRKHHGHDATAPRAR